MMYAWALRLIKRNLISEARVILVACRQCFWSELELDCISVGVCDDIVTLFFVFFGVFFWFNMTL